MYIIIIVILLIVIKQIFFANSSSQTVQKSMISYTVPEPVTFAIKLLSEVQETDGVKKTWLATYEKENKKALFRFEIIFKPLKKIDEKGIAVAFSKGIFYKEKNSDPSVLLVDLKRVLDAKILPTDVIKQESLPFTIAFLGTNLSKSEDNNGIAGSFNENPPGQWTPAKVFVAYGNGEFFLNINETEKIAEISIKDSSYGDIVLAELAKIL